MSKTIITYGTFDMFHIGHLNLFKRLKGMGDKLIVAVSTDEFNASKGKRTLIPYEQRAEIVAAVKYVDLVIPEMCWEQKAEDVKTYNCDIFAIGNDWEGKFDFLKPQCEVVYLERTDGVSTTALKRSLNKLLSVSQEDISFAFDVISQLRTDLA
jgi:glycerol-3-phosphate cytidylyltransferase